MVKNWMKIITLKKCSNVIFKKTVSKFKNITVRHFDPKLNIEYNFWIKQHN